MSGYFALKATFYSFVLYGYFSGILKTVNS
jgi:hypothetical protein